MEDELNDLDTIQRLCNTTVNHFHPIVSSSTQLVCLGLMQRLRDCSVALQLLITNFDKTPCLEFSAGIILRSLVLDALLGLNMYKISEECATNKKSPLPDFEDFSNKVLADGLDHTIKYIQMSRDNNLKITTDARLREVFSDFANMYKGYLRPYTHDGSKPIPLHEKYRQNELLMNVVNIKVLNNQVIDIWDAYQMFSKIDHFGIQYFTVTEIINSQPKRWILDNIHTLVAFNSIVHLVLYHTADTDEFLKKQSDNSLKLFVSKFPDLKDAGLESN